MRVLLNGLIASHVLPALPLAWALRAAGHEVLVAGGADVAEAGRSAGLNSVVITEATRTAAAAPPPSGKPAGPPAGRPSWDDLLRRKEPRLRAGIGGFTDVVDAWRPDLVVADPLGFGAFVAAAAAGVPAVVHRWGIQESTTEMDAAARRVFGDLCRELGSADGLPEPALVLDPCPPSLRPSGAAGTRPVRFLPHSGAADLPTWALAPARAGRVCVLLGIWGTEVLARSGRLGEVVDAIAPAADGVPGRDVVVLLPEEHHAAVGALPAGVRLHRPLPLGLLLPGAAAVVHHGGSGTALTALTHGVPQVVLAPEQPHLAAVADTIQASGTGRALTDTDGDLGKAVAAALAEVTGDPAYRTAAGAVAAELAAMPAPAELVGLLEGAASR